MVGLMENGLSNHNDGIGELIIKTAGKLPTIRPTRPSLNKDEITHLIIRISAP